MSLRKIIEFESQKEKFIECGLCGFLSELSGIADAVPSNLPLFFQEIKVLYTVLSQQCELSHICILSWVMEHQWSMKFKIAFSVQIVLQVIKKCVYSSLRQRNSNRLHNSSPNTATDNILGEFMSSCYLKLLAYIAYLFTGYFFFTDGKLRQRAIDWHAIFKVMSSVNGKIRIWIQGKYVENTKQKMAYRA